MRIFLVLLEREMKSYFYSPVAYIVLCFFLVLTGFNAYAMISVLNQGPMELTLVFAFFNNAIFWFAFIPLIPLLTMRLYSEEFKLGTIETLMTAPVNDWQVVLSKFAGAFLFYMVLWVPTTLYFVIFKYITRDQASDAPRRIWRQLSPADADGRFLSLARLPRFGAHAQPDRRGDHGVGVRGGVLLYRLVWFYLWHGQPGLPGFYLLLFQHRPHAALHARPDRYPPHPSSTSR